MHTIRSAALRAVSAALVTGALALMTAAPAEAGSPGFYPPGHVRGPAYVRPAYPPYYRGPAARVVVINRLPPGCRHIVYRGQPYYYHGSGWYRPYGARFVAVAPPAGLIVDRRGVTLAARVPIVRW